MSRFTIISFKNYLRGLPSEVVFAHLRGEEGEQRRVLSTGVINELVERFAAPTALQQRFAALPELAQSRCALAYLLLPQGVIATPGWEQAVDAFLIYQIKRESGELWLKGFDEFMEPLQEQLLQTLRQLFTSSVHKSQNRFYTFETVNDTMVVLLLAAQGLLTHTRTGALTKASRLLCGKLLHCAKGVWRAEVESIVQKLLLFGLQRGLLCMDEDRYHEQEQRLLEWVSYEREFLYEDIGRFFAEQVNSWQWPLINALFEHYPGEWFSTAALEPPVESAVRQALMVGSFVGLLQVRRDGEGILFGTALASEEMGAVAGAEIRPMVLPDFSVIIPQECSHDVLYWYSRFGALGSFDKIYRGQLSRESISDALAGGYRAEQILERLAQWEAPGNVVSTVREWIGEFGRVSLYQGAVLLACSDTLAHQLEGFEPLRGMIEPVEVQRVYVVKAGFERVVEERMRAMGFDTRFPRMAAARSCSLEQLLAPPSAQEGAVVFGLENSAQEVPRPAPGGKYGSELQQRSESEIDNIVDYAILMGQGLKIDYEGTTGIKRGVYTVEPLRMIRSGIIGLEGRDCASNTNKVFLRAKIIRIGVVGL